MPRLLSYFKNNPTKTIALSATFALSFLTALSLYLNISNLQNEMIDLAIQQAKDNWNKDRAFRVWGTRHGGVYVKPDQRTPPNPFLTHVDKRDVVTTDGQALTLMNPAYMMRQITEEFDQLYGIKGKITGKILLNPINKADEWEYQALTQFERGVKEVIEESDIDGVPYIRYMKPMFMTEGCIKCHGHLGFKKGDLRGGVSVSIPLIPYFEEADKITRILLSTHMIVWLLGFIFIIIFYLIVSEKSKENKALIERMEYNTKRLQNSLNAAHAGTINYDINRDKIHLDSTSNKIFGLAKHTQYISYLQWRSLIHPDDVDGFEKSIQGIIRSQRQRLQIEFRAIASVNEIHWVKLWCNIFRNPESGEAHSIDGIMLDISSEKLNERVIREKEAAERFAQKQSTFLTNMSHEFRTPLHGILSFSKIGLNRIKENEIEPQKFTDFFNSINVSASRLLNLLNDLLDLSKLEAEQMKLNPASHNLLKTTQEILKEQQYVLAEKKIQVELAIPECSTQAIYDKLRISQVISNLLSNAIKFTEHNGMIHISFENVPFHPKQPEADENSLTARLNPSHPQNEEVQALRFSIKDTGRGIPSTELESIFDKFIQSSRNDPGSSGTGLGLAICKEIIEAHQGKIWAEQDSENGAAFYFIIPYQDTI